MTFPFIFPANRLKTSSPPFSPSKTARRQVHNVAMIIFRGKSLSLIHVFSFGFIRGEAEKNKKKFSKRSEPNLGKIPGPPQRLAPGGESVFAVRTRDVVENNTEGARRTRLSSVQTKVSERGWYAGLMTLTVVAAGEGLSFVLGNATTPADAAHPGRAPSGDCPWQDHQRYMYN